MQEIEIIKVENAGKFLCRPKASTEDDSNDYLEFVASLNTFYEKKKHESMMLQLNTGDLCACFTNIGEEIQRVWYRGQIISWFQSKAGLIAKVLLVDEGDIVCVTKQRMRELDKRFIAYPVQIMQCKLDGVSPVTLAPNAEFVWSMKKANHWDSAATTFVQEKIKGKCTCIRQVARDEDGISYLVQLYVQENGNFININNSLIEKEYATKPQSSKQNTGSGNVAERKLLEQLLGECTPPKHETVANNKTMSPVDFNIDDSGVCESQNNTSYSSTRLSGQHKPSTANNLTEVTPTRSEMISLRMKSKKEQERKFIEKGNKDCVELLKIIHGGGYMEQISKQSDTTGTSDLSDMETTPIPKMESFKSHRSNKKTAATFLTEAIGKESSDLFSDLYGLEKDETSTPKSSKRVSFSPHNQVYDLKRDEDIVPGKSFQLINQTAKQSTPTDNLSSYFDDGSNILKLLKPGSESSGLSSDSPIIDEVVVYGKLKREPLLSLRELDLPFALKPVLRDWNVKSPTPFQAHMWPNVSTFRNIVGIADRTKSMKNEVLSYALPILRDIMEGEDMYKKLGKGNGPYLMVLVNSWREAQEVYDIFEKLTEYYRSSVRVDVRYGGMDKEAERDIRLVNGCEIIIATVPSINRALELGYTNFNRLCHIVFENSDMLVEKFTEDIKLFMRSYTEFLKHCKKPDLFHQQIISIGMKWSYGIRSLMSSYMDNPLIIINNKVEAALYAKVPLVVELCNSNERLEYLVAFLEVDATEHSTVVFTNSAKGADSLKAELLNYSQSVNVVTEFTQPVELKDVKHEWNANFGKASPNVLIMSDNAIIKSGIRNATCVLHYNYPQKKSTFGNRLHCLADTIRKNETAESKAKVVSHVFVTEQNNGVRYSTGLVKLLRRAGQVVPDLLKSMALSSRELKEEQKEYSDLCPRLKLFGECSFMDDCQERHKIFKDKDMLGLCPTTGFVKVLVLDVISASNFWGRIVDHRLPYNPSGTSCYNTSVFMKLAFDLQSHYADDTNHMKCVTVAVYDICVTYSRLNGYQRVRVEKILESEFERPKLVEVFGVDNGLTFTTKCQDLLKCAEQFARLPPQAIEIVTCCVKPVERSDTWTHEASMEIEKRLVGKTLEGRIQFSLQNTIWVDPLVEKELLVGMQTKTYSLDVGRDLIQMGYAEKNVKHVENLRKLLYDVSGHPLEKRDDKKSLPAIMLEHETSYLQDDDYEDVYISAVVNPTLFFVQRAENCEMIEKLDEKIDATMKVRKVADEHHVYPVGYICVAKFSVDDRWYRARVVDVNEKQYEVFYVDHGDREWVYRKHVANSWSDILTPTYQAIECSFKDITPIGKEWSEEDGDKFWDLAKDRLLVAKVVTTACSDYLNESIKYEVELYDTTGDQTINICHQLVFMGVANGESYCLQAMFSHASLDTRNKVYERPVDRCADLCLAIHRTEEPVEKTRKVEELYNIVINATTNDDVINNGALPSTCKLLTLTRMANLQLKLMYCLKHWARFGQEYCNVINDNDAIKTVCNIYHKSLDEENQKEAVETLMVIASDSWYHDAVRENGFIKSACTVLETSAIGHQLVELSLDGLILFCRNNEISCNTFRQEDGLRSLCHHFEASTDERILMKCTELFRIVLSYWRNQEKMREIGGYQVLSSLLNKNLNNQCLENVLQTLIMCTENSINTKNYLLMIQADKNIKKCSSLPIRYKMEVRSLFSKLLQELKPDPTSKVVEKEINPLFLEKHVIGPDSIKETITPMTVWSQRRRTVTLAVRVRGATSAEANVDGNRLYFRTLLYHQEYLLELDLFAKADLQEKQPMVKGGEILIVLNKKDEEKWPRLLQSQEKHPCISVDFDRWVEEFPLEDSSSYEDSADIDGVVLFKPGLPKPPPSCYTNCQVDDPSVVESSGTDSDNDMDSDEDHVREYAADYFNI